MASSSWAAVQIVPWRAHPWALQGLLAIYLYSNPTACLCFNLYTHILRPAFRDANKFTTASTKGRESTTPRGANNMARTTRRLRCQVLNTTSNSWSRVLISYDITTGHKCKVERSGLGLGTFPPLVLGRDYLGLLKLTNVWGKHKPNNKNTRRYLHALLTAGNIRPNNPD